jgi:hypothetical protein
MWGRNGRSRYLYSTPARRARVCVRAGVSRVIQQPTDDAATATVSLSAVGPPEGIAGTQAYMAPEMLVVLRRLAAVCCCCCC